MPEYISVF